MCEDSVTEALSIILLLSG